MRHLCLLLLAIATGQSALGQHSSLLDTNVPSQFFGWHRGIHVYLPPSYETQPQRHYPVLYLQDGQNVFSSAGTNAAFGWGSWELDLTADKLSHAGKMQEIIMVAVDNSWGRRGEYGGLHRTPDGPATNSAFENYEAFLITELKPRIDRDYRTLPGAAHTAVMGSSVGGLCSVVLAWDHPEIFGAAASLSGSDIHEQTNFLNEVLNSYHGPPKPFRVYLDSGVVDFTGGDDGRSLTGQVAAEFQRIGWTDENLELFTDSKPLTPEQLEQTGLRRGKWAEAQKSQHNEFYWRLRAWRALTFLFPPENPNQDPDFTDKHR
jgi:enterochelin esterase-like enzyme